MVAALLLPLHTSSPRRSPLALKLLPPLVRVALSFVPSQTAPQSATGASSEDRTDGVTCGQELPKLEIIFDVDWRGSRTPTRCFLRSLACLLFLRTASSSLLRSCESIRSARVFCFRFISDRGGEQPISSSLSRRVGGRAPGSMNSKILRKITKQSSS